VRYWLLAAMSAFSAFAVFATAASLIARLAGDRITRAMAEAPPRSRERGLFAVRSLPAGAAVVAAFGVALPIFLWFEQPGTDEPVGRTLALIAAGGLFLLLRGVWRAGAAWRSTARVVRDWQRRGRQLDGLHGLDTPMRAYAVDEPFPVVAVVGIVTPRLFVAERVLRECTAGEIAAMVAHECAHVSARDNVKRLIIRSCQDVFGSPRHLETSWSAAAEEAADAQAASRHPSARLDLAQALIHVARLATPRAPALASAFYLGGSIETRVRRLVDPPPAPVPARWPRLAVPAAAILLAVTIVFAAPAVHALMEEAVRLLP